MSDGLPHYVFVGAFRQGDAVDGSVGGQLHACRTLLASDVTSRVRFTIIDSTMQTVPAPPLPRRILPAAARFTTFLRRVSQRDVDGALIFTSAGLSLLEKGLMAVYAHSIGKRVVLSPRSGLIRDDVSRSAAMRRTIVGILRSCDVILCQSISWQDYYSDLTKLPDDRFVVVPNWLDVRDYPEAGPTAHDDDTVKVLYMGWLEPYKGILDLIEAVAQQSTSLDHCRFIVCGRGSLDQRARELTMERQVSDLFDFRGWVTGDDKRAAFEEADVLVLPSHREGMPNALLEAMATGLAVVACSVGGVPEVIVDEEVGVLVEPKAPTALGEALVALTLDRARMRALGVAARQHILAHHDIDVLWPRVERALQP